MSAAKFKPGDRITWHHYHTDGSVTMRTGTVLDRAPRMLEGEAGTTFYGRPFDAQHTNWWVQPDEPFPADLHTTLAVGLARRDVYAHGRSVPGVWGSQVAFKGTLFSSDDRLSPLGVLMNRAAVEAAKNREKNRS